MNCIRNMISAEETYLSSAATRQCVLQGLGISYIQPFGMDILRMLEICPGMGVTIRAARRGRLGYTWPFDVQTPWRYLYASRT